jgi:hypothetical protein
MFYVATTEGGTSSAPLDVCKTPAPPGPPVPTPYLNKGSLSQATRATCSMKVKVRNQPVINVNSIIPMTSGDEGGSLGGVISGMIKGLAKPGKGSAKVKAEGIAVVFHTCPMKHNGNNSNAPTGVQDTPSQTQVCVAG